MQRLKTALAAAWKNVKPGHVSPLSMVIIYFSAVLVFALAILIGTVVLVA